LDEVVANSPVVRIFGREPAMWAGLANAIIYVLGATVFHLSPSMESLLIAVTAAVLGFIVAWQTHDGLSAAILGLAKAILALLLGFGMKVSADQQAAILGLAAALVAMFVRTQATAPVPAPAK
jgi:AcrR family transcriptional regulator